MLNPPLRSVSGVRVTCKSLSSKILAKLPLLFRELFLVLLLALTMLRFIEVLCFFFNFLSLVSPDIYQTISPGLVFP